MLWLPQSSRVNVVTNYGIVGSTTGGTGCPSSGTTLLDGTVTELISAANNVQDSWGISIAVHDNGASATAAEAALDILVGGATDDVLIAALLCGYARGDGGGINGGWFFPVHIPAGLRIAGRFASIRTSITTSVMVAIYGGGTPPFRVGRKVTTIGTQVNNARGVAITPSNATTAAVQEMTASSAEDYFAFNVGFQAASDTTIGVQGYVNVGIGVGASTEDRIGTWLFHKHGGEGISGPFPSMPAFADVPAGSRLSILSSGPGAAESGQDALIYAVS